jgi:hypothetical protein
MNLSETVASKMIERMGCQYMGPIQDPSASVQYCGKAVLKGKSYCAEHYPMMYQTGTATSKKKSAAIVARKQHEWAPGELEDLMMEVYQELIDEGEIVE